MARKFSSARCVHCLQHFDSLTSDHVLPISWYPRIPSNDLEKWQIPACDKCNKEYGQLENELLLRFGLCLAPNALESFGIPEKALRSIDPERARNERDQEHRQKKRRKTLRELRSSKEFPSDSLLPGFGPYNELEKHQQKIIPIPVAEFRRLGEKLTRGTAYVLRNGYIEANHRIEIFLPGEIDSSPFVEILERLGKHYTCGPALKVRIVSDPSDQQNGLFEFVIWGNLQIYAVVEPIVD